MRVAGLRSCSAPGEFCHRKEERERTPCQGGGCAESGIPISAPQLSEDLQGSLRVPGPTFHQGVVCSLSLAETARQAGSRRRREASQEVIPGEEKTALQQVIEEQITVIIGKMLFLPSAF